MEKIITHNYESLSSYGCEDFVFSGIDKNGNTIIGSWMDENYDEKYIEHIYSVVTPLLLESFKAKEITYLEVLKLAKAISIVRSNYEDKIIKMKPVTLDKIPSDFMPTKDSYLVSDY